MAVTRTYIGSHTDDANASSYTFSSVSIGSASSDRIVVVCIGSRKTGGATSVSSATIAGVSATVQVSINNSTSNNTISAIITAAVPTGTTGDIVVNFADSMLRCGVSVYTVTGANTTPHATDSDISTPLSLSINVPAGGACIATAFNGTVSTDTWTGVTEDFAATLEAIARYTSASDNFASAQTPLSLDPGFSAHQTATACAISFDVAATGVTGTASHQATTATHAATGIREITGSSSHQAATATQAASGTVGAVITGTGAHQAAAATHAATGAREITGASTHQAATATQSASGAVSGTISGTAAHQATTATHAATGLRVITGTASHQAATATHSATGQVGNIVTGTGSHQAATATHAATGLRVITGTGANAATRATQAATGLRVITGTGYHQATTATQAASDQQPGLVTATATGRKSITNISDRYSITNISDRYSIAG